ncbi:hypothetical protein NKG99_20645 [Mesorhizobium sp. M1409]|uniref:hypothetical protein n=1 Tax=Mesorhizobium sp. M1409 TaxID=2957100 RepID=UPI00333B276C
MNTDSNTITSAAERWRIWWTGVVAVADGTPEGQAFNAGGFHLEHTGGGCTAWERPVDGTGWRILITDSEGLGHTLEGDHSFRPGKPDCWLIGAQSDDDDGTDCEEADSVEQALEIADAIEQRIREKTL